MTPLDAELLTIAQTRLERREATIGPIADPAAWLEAVMRGLRHERLLAPRPNAGAGQAALIARHEAQRRPLPPPADDAAKAQARPWFATMRQTLAEPGG